VRTVLDTNVLVSGIFFGGVPGRILDAWASGRFSLVASPSILAEYRRVGQESATFAWDPEFKSVFDLIMLRAELMEDCFSDQPLCRDPADDKFLLCAASAAAVLVSGDRDLLACNGVLGVRVLTPRAFLTLIED
jgi:putative PIN family toxin of toxin-antitoxin system